MNDKKSSKEIEEIVSQMGTISKSHYKRNPESILPVVQSMVDVLIKNPNLRLGQLLVNALNKFNKENNTSVDLFNIWDEDLLKALREYND